MSNHTTDGDIIAAMKKKIQRAEDQLADLEDQRAICDDDADALLLLIREQKDYLCGLYESMNNRLAHKEA